MGVAYVVLFALRVLAWHVCIHAMRVSHAYMHAYDR